MKKYLPNDKEKIVEIRRTKLATYYLRYTYCGKKNCHCCPHGPYWYAKLFLKGYTDKAGRKHVPREITKYIGKNFVALPGDQEAQRLPGKKRIDSGDLVDELEIKKGGKK